MSNDAGPQGFLHKIPGSIGAGARPARSHSVYPHQRLRIYFHDNLRYDSRRYTARAASHTSLPPAPPSIRFTVPGAGGRSWVGCVVVHSRCHVVPFRACGASGSLPSAGAVCSWSPVGGALTLRDPCKTAASCHLRESRKESCTVWYGVALAFRACNSSGFPAHLAFAYPPGTHAARLGQSRQRQIASCSQLPPLPLTGTVVVPTRRPRSPNSLSRLTGTHSFGTLGHWRHCLEGCAILPRAHTCTATGVLRSVCGPRILPGR